MGRVTEYRTDPELVRTAGQPQPRDDALDARQGRALHADLGPAGLPARRPVQVLGRADGRGLGRRAGPGRGALPRSPQTRGVEIRYRRRARSADRRRRRRPRRRGRQAADSVETIRAAQRWCWPAAASRPTPSGARATSARAGTWPRCAARASTPATASAWRWPSARARRQLVRLPRRRLGPQRARLRRPRGRRRLPEALLSARRHDQRRGRAVRRRRRRFPQLHLRQVRPRHPRPARPVRLAGVRRQGRAICCATNTASSR